jgi:hypothetical protein
MPAAKSGSETIVQPGCTVSPTWYLRPSHGCSPITAMPSRGATATSALIDFSAVSISVFALSSSICLTWRSSELVAFADASSFSAFSTPR